MSLEHGSSLPEGFRRSDLEPLSDRQLEDLLRGLRELLHERALVRADPEALTEEMFATGFGRDGLPLDPLVRDGMLVAAGGKVERSHLSHRCRFVRLADSWVWEGQSVVSDVVRHSAGPSRSMRSVTLAPVVPGDAVDLVTCRTRNGVHELVSVRSFEVTGDGLLLVGSRTVSRTDHR